jgi:hypothetical protein
MRDQALKDTGAGSTRRSCSLKKEAEEDELKMSIYRNSTPIRHPRS